MEIQTNRFGRVECSPPEVLHFGKGLLGFENLKDYLVIPLSNNPAFFWLQAVENGEVAFLVTDPFLFFPGYEIELNDQVKQTLRLEKREQVVIYTTVSIPAAGIQGMTTNLAGPLIINLQSRLGMQYILNSTDYHTKHLLFSVKNPQTKAGE